MSNRTATCSCGQLSATTDAAPIRISLCHCHACQRRTGSVFGVQARFHEKDVVLSGESKPFTRVADSGRTITFHFCPKCGATVFYRLDSVAGVVAIPVGAFADPTFPAPIVSVFEQRKHAWVGLPDGIEQLA